MKTYSTILKCSLILNLFLFFTACGGSQSTYTGETRMSTNNLFTVTLEENLNDKNVTAEIELNGNNTDIPAEYSTAELYIGDKFIGAFNNGFISFVPEVFGDVECSVIFYDAENTAIATLTDVEQFYIETWYVAYNSSENGDVKPATNGITILQPDNVSYGSCDMIWMYNIRVPKDKKITLSYSASRVTDTSLKFGGAVLDCHFRFADYKERITTYGGLQAKYFDTETDKWVSSPLELTHGIYDVYVCPNAGADKSRLFVYHKTDEIDGSFSALYKTITNWPF
jgi:hypothetical protein